MKGSLCAYRDVWHGLFVIRSTINGSIENTSVLFIGNVNCVVSATEEIAEREYMVSREEPTVDSIINRAVALAKEVLTEDEVTVPELEYALTELAVRVPITEKGIPIVSFYYKLDDVWIEDYPHQECCCMRK